MEGASAFGLSGAEHEVHDALRPRVEALLACAHTLATASGAADKPSQQSQTGWRAEVDLHSLSREALEAYLHERGITAPSSYSVGDLVTLAKQSKFMMKRPTPSAPPSCGFQLEKRASPIDNAGYGLFIKGTAKKGTVLGFYPGCVYSESDMPLVYPHIFTDNGYLAFRSDKKLIDASSNGRSRQAFLSAWGREHKGQTPPPPDELIDFAALYSNPFAVGQFINHPPKDTKPNVISVLFDFVEGELPAHLYHYIPNAHFLPSSQSPTVTSGLIVVASKDLEDGEELLMDYHYGTCGSPIPSWYHPVERKKSE